MLLAQDPGVMCGEAQKAWPTSSTNCTNSCFYPAERTSISLSALTLRLFPHSFVTSPISCMNRNAVTMMDGGSYDGLKQKESSTELQIMFWFLLLLFFFSPCSLFCFFCFFSYNTSLQSQPLQPRLLRYRSPDRDSGEAGVEPKASEVTLDPRCFCLFVCLPRLKQRVHGIENSI